MGSMEDCFRRGCNEVDDGENDTKADLQGEWLEDYLDALEEMEE